jgi:hypothetical protein
MPEPAVMMIKRALREHNKVADKNDDDRSDNSELVAAVELLTDEF